MAICGHKCVKACLHNTAPKKRRHGTLTHVSDAVLPEMAELKGHNGRSRPGHLSTRQRLMIDEKFYSDRSH